MGRGTDAFDFVNRDKITEVFDSIENVGVPELPNAVFMKVDTLDDKQVKIPMLKIVRECTCVYRDFTMYMTEPPYTKTYYTTRVDRTNCPMHGENNE